MNNTNAEMFLMLLVIPGKERKESIMTICKKTPLLLICFLTLLSRII